MYYPPNRLQHDADACAPAGQAMGSHSTACIRHRSRHPYDLSPPPRRSNNWSVFLQLGLPLQLVGLPVGAPVRSARILVAAHTNTAVDRVLTGLVGAGYTGATRGPPAVLQQCVAPNACGNIIASDL